MQTTPINAIHRRALAAEPTADITTTSGRLALLAHIDLWLAHASECLALSYELRALGNKQQQAVYYQQWFNIMVQVDALHALIEDTMRLTNTDRQAA